MIFLMLCYPVTLMPRIIPHAWVDSPKYPMTYNCSASIAYDFINNDNDGMKGWKWFWKMYLPQQFKTFLYLIFLNKLPTNHLRARTWIATSDLCPRCNNFPETLQHLFRDCPKAVALWDKIPSGRLMRAGFGNSTSDWISHNLKRKKLLHVGTRYTLEYSLLHLSLAKLERLKQKKFL